MSLRALDEAEIVQRRAFVGTITEFPEDLDRRLQTALGILEFTSAFVRDRQVSQRLGGEPSVATVLVFGDHLAVDEMASSYRPVIQ